MTNAIEQSKREMYVHIAAIRSCEAHPKAFGLCESAIESYLELLRQDHEALHETARKRFEDIQGLEAVNADQARQLEIIKGQQGMLTSEICKKITKLQSGQREIQVLENRLASMTDERDSLRNRQQASDHAQAQGATVHQSSGENVSCATLDGKTAAILGALLDAQSVMVEYLVPNGIRAKDAIGKMIPILDNEKLYVAMRGFEHPSGGYAVWFLNNDKCMHSFPSGEQCVFCGVGK